MQAILLAGGLGTRLRSVVSDRPKPMALIQDKPFMEYVIQESLLLTLMRKNCLAQRERSRMRPVL